MLRPRLSLRTGWALALALAALTVWLGFEQGGYFADTTAWAAVGVAVAIALGAAIRGRPPGGVTRGVAWAAGLLSLFAIWVLLSGAWSDAEGRALIEFDRALLYVLILLLFGVAVEPRLTLANIPVAFSLAALVLCAAGFLARTLPEQWPFADPTLSTRLDFPFSYPNALGALAALGLVMSLHVASWERRHTVVRALAAAALPVLASTLVLTFSRGAAVAVVLGVVAYLALGWSPGLPSAILAAGPTVALAVVTALNAELITSDRPGTAAALAEGEDLAAIVALAAFCAAILLLMLRPLERRVADFAGRISRRAVVVGAAAVLGVAALGLAATGSLDDIDPVSGGTGDDGELRERLTPSQVVSLGAQNRPKYWRVATDAFSDEPLRGHGAGSFQKLWARERPVSENVTEGHSVYLETAAELGLVGVGLMLAGLGLIVAAFVRGLRRTRRPLYAGLLAAAIVWLAHAGIDWDWEMPALTVWLFAAGGCALAAPAHEPARSSSPRGSWTRWLPRVVIAGGLLVLALTPASVGLSQARLDDSAESFQRGDCRGAERSALDSISALDSRPEPYTFLAYCAVREGQPRRAVAQMRLALERDPDAWDLHYGLALMRGAARLDPRPAALAALQRNPREPILRAAVEGFATSNPRAWERYATAAPLPLVGAADDDP